MADDHVRTRSTLQALTLPDRIRQSLPALRQYYIRAAVDNIRRSSSRGAPMTWDSAEVDISYHLACYMKVIKRLFEARETPIASAAAMMTLVFDVARDIRCGQDLHRDERGLPPATVDEAVTQVAVELLQRFNNPTSHDPVETVALIEYRLRYLGPFFGSTDRRISEALGAFFLMRCDGFCLPDYADRDTLDKVHRGLPKRASAESDLQHSSRYIGALRADTSFMAWVNAFRMQFSALKPPLAMPGPRQAPTDRWKIKRSPTFDHQSTVYDYPETVTRPPGEIDAIRDATGSWAEDIVVFRPRRIALHETIAAAVTRLQMEHPTTFLSEWLSNPNATYLTSILPAAKALEVQFKEDCELLEDYIDTILNDHFHLRSPNGESRELLRAVTEKIFRRLDAGEYDPRQADSHEVLKHCVADELLRRRYKRIIRALVDERIDAYLANNPALVLHPKPNRERVAWVAAGGSAAGKTTLAQLILREYRELGNRCHLCQVNPDHYRVLLLPRTGKANEDCDHGTRTHSESLHVRNLVMERLSTMIDGGEAPDFWVSATATKGDRMEPAGKGGAKVNVYVVSCSATTAVDRAFERALNADPTNEDRYRFMPTRDLLKGHRDASASLPGTLHARRRDLRLYNTEDRKTTLIAAMDSYNRELRVVDPWGFVDFVKKSLLTIDAERSEDVYKPDVPPSAIAAEICRYLERDHHAPKDAAPVSLNFRYHLDYVPNPLFKRVGNGTHDGSGGEKLANGGDGRNVAVEQLLVGSQPESYFWAGHERAVVRDFASFILAFGNELAEALLIELGNRTKYLSVRHYLGDQLFLIDKEAKMFYPVEIAHRQKELLCAPVGITADVLNGVMDGAVRMLEPMMKGFKYDEGRQRGGAHRTRNFQD